jgi:CheY-like chemotaxis protein
VCLANVRLCCCKGEELISGAFCNDAEKGEEMTLKQELGGHRILIVDDHDLSIRHALASLENSSSEIRAAYSAEEALRLVKTWLPDVICMDLHLQDSEGIEVIRKIRQTWPSRQLAPKIIVMSGDNLGLSGQDMAALQIDCLLVKPISGYQLRQLTGVTRSGYKSIPSNEKCEPELYGLFLNELSERLPQLDDCFARLELNEIADILHQLIASAAISQELRFESELRILNASCQNGGTHHEIATRYHAVLESARKLMSQL